MDKGIKTITIDEFRKLPDSEKGEMYKYMSDHDKFVWRTTCPIGPGEIILDFKLSPEEKKEITEIRKRLLKEGILTQEEFDQLESDMENRH